jgi:hypothetical protein
LESAHESRWKEARVAEIREQPHGAQRAARLPEKESQELRQRFGREDEEPKIDWHQTQKNDLCFPLMTREQARRILAARAKAGALGPARNPARGGR